MANLDPRYVTAVAIGEVFLDKNTGEVLAGGKIYYSQDENRNISKPVYTITGSPPNYVYTPLPNPIILGANGTYQDNTGNNVAVYYFPYDENDDLQLYFVDIYSSTDVPQLTREAWPNITDETDPYDDSGSKVTNELSNGQFVDVYFNPLKTYTYTLPSSSSTFNFAPDWDLVVTGVPSSTVILERVNLAGSLNAPSLPTGADLANPAYALRVTPSAGVTSVKLRQRLNHNPGLFSGGYISGYAVAKSDTSDGTRVTIQYSESDTVVANDIVFADISNILFTEIKGSVFFPASTNPQTSDVGYLDILIALPLNVVTLISAIQIVGMDQNSFPASYDQQPVNREQDFTFHNYKEQLIVYPKSTILTGWQFGVNPWQFSSPVPVQPIAQEGYVTDQTIMVTEFADMLNVGRANSGDNGSLFIEAQSGNQQGRFAIIQYVDIETVRPYWGQYLSSLVRSIITTNSGTQLPFKLELIYSTSAPADVSPINAFPVFPSTDLSYKAQWTKISPQVQNIYTMQTGNASVGGNGYPYYSFNKMQLPSSVIEGTGYIGIVFYTVGYNSNEVLQSGDSIHLQDISLVPNEYAIAASPESYETSLLKCQYHYEKCWSQDVAIGTAGSENTVTFPALYTLDSFGNAGNVYKNIFQLDYLKKRTRYPEILLYSESSAVVDFVTLVKYASDGSVISSVDVAADQWEQRSLGDSRVKYIPKSHVIINFPGGNGTYVWMEMFYTIDARLGLVP